MKFGVVKGCESVIVILVGRAGSGEKIGALVGLVGREGLVVGGGVVGDGRMRLGGDGHEKAGWKISGRFRVVRVR